MLLRQEVRESALYNSVLNALGAGPVAAAYATGGEALPTYIGKQFESICLQWIQRKNAAGELAFHVFEFGQWWGTDSKTREQVDIDVVAANRNEKRVFVGECKWRNRFDWAEAARTLEHRAQLLKGFNEQSLCLFTKNRLNESAADELRVKGVKAVCAEDLYV